MKKYIVPTIIISILFLSGCEDYLDRNPLDKISTPTFWKSKADFEMALTANYGILQTAEWSEFLPNWDNFTDNSYGQFNYGGTYSIVTGAIDPSTGGYIGSIYKQAYIAIGRQNLFLQQLAAYEGPDFSDADKKIAEAEVRFFRAFMYFHLYDFYGDVPLVTEPLTIETQYQPKGPAAQVLAQATADIDFAIANLEAVPYVDNKGHVTKS